MNAEVNASSAANAREPFGRRSWPSRVVWQAFLLYAIQVQFVWILVYGGSSWITEQRSLRFDFSCPQDAAIPFVPSAAIVYLSLLPMLWGAPIVLRTSIRLKQFARSLQILIIVSGVGFLLMPSKEPVVAAVPGGFPGLLFNLADAVNLKHNLLPSLHVGMPVVCAYAYGRQLPRRVALFFWAWAAAIALSTLLTHQHYLADVVAGGVVGWLVASISYSKTNLSA